MGLGVTETNVVFEDFDTLIRKHEPRVERTAVVDAVSFEAGESGFDHFFFDFGLHGGCDPTSWGVGTHTTCVETGVAFTRSFVVLAGRQADEVFARCDHVDGGFFAVEGLFDYDLLAAAAKGIAFEHIFNCCDCFILRFGHNDALTGGEAASFDDDGSRMLLKVVEGGCNFGKITVGRGRDVVFGKKVFAESLARFELCSGGVGAIGGDTDGGQRVDETEAKRHFGAYYDEADALRLGKSNHPLNFFDRDVKALRL